MKKSTILGTLVGGVSFFLLGWLIFGLLLTGGMYSSETNSNIRPESDMIWWAMVLSNFIWAYFITWVIEIRGSQGAIPGMMTGLYIGLLMTLAFDLGMYAMSTMFPSGKDMVMDIVANSLLCAVVGLIIGLVVGKTGTQAKEA